MRQLPSGNWQASYVAPNGERIKARDTFITRDAGEIWLSGAWQVIKDGKWKPEQATELFGKYAANWVATRRRRDGTPLKESTREKYLQSLTAVNTDLEHVELTEITAPLLRRVHQKHVQDSGATTAGHHMRVIRAILNTARKDELIETNPMPSELCQSKTGIKHRPPTTEELAALIKNIGTKYKLCLLIGAYGGLRLGERLALTRGDLKKTGDHYIIIVERQAVYVDKQWAITTLKADQDDDAGRREVALPAWMTPEVDAHLKNVGQSNDALLFPSTKPGSYAAAGWNNAWTKARKTAGVENVRGHDLRHYYGTALAEANASAPLIQAALGHATITMSMKYVHAAKGASPELADLLKPA